MTPLVPSLCRVFLCMLVSFCSLAQTKTTPPITPAFFFDQQAIPDPLQLKEQQPVSLPANVSDSWYQQAMQHLQEREYFMKPMKASYVYGAPNRKQSMAYLFSATGYQVKQADMQSFTSLWEASFQCKGIGRNNALQLLDTDPTIIHNENQLTYHYTGFSIQYINNVQGMRQNFIVQNKPAGDGPLTIQVGIESNLQPALLHPGKLVLQEPNNSHTISMVYDQLHVWDATNKSLNAHFELSAERVLSIITDDKNAVYPITIDPLNHLPDWTDNGAGLLFVALNDLSVPALYGTSVSGAGDVNDDNFEDIIIGAPGYVEILNISGNSFNAASVGGAFVYFGSVTGPTLTPSEALQPTSQLGALFGFSVSGAGDLNNDGFDDIVIGAPGDHTTIATFPVLLTVAVGRIYVYYGSNTNFNGNVNSEPTVSLNLGLQPGDFLSLSILTPNPLYGFSVSNAGDVNGDGFDDVLVGSPAYTRLLPTPVLGGRVDVYYGSNTGIPTTPSSTILGSLLGGLFGYSVSTAGDVNNDNFDDIIAGAPASISLLPLNAGTAYVFHGSATGITATSVTSANIALQTTPGFLDQTLFGMSVSTAGDVNGDNFDDVIVGEPLSAQLLSTQLSVSGKAHIFYGSAAGITNTGSTQLTSPRGPDILGLVQGNLLFGYSVSNAGDVNCDGLSDVIIGEPGSTAISLDAGLLGLVTTPVLSGKAYIFYGRAGTGPLNSPSYQIQETSAVSVANLIGYSVSDAGDVNGDGNDDVLVGAPNGTLNLGTSITGIIGSALSYVTTNTIGSAYAFFGCLAEEDLDFDNDGVPDAIDLDDDNDGIVDLAEYPGPGLTEDPSGDADGDGIPNYMDADFTGCGGLNGSGICTNFDKDGDGVPNSFDIDADNDGIPDVIEAGGVDVNGDGVLDNFTDPDADGLAQTIDASNTGASGSGNGLGVQDFDSDGVPNNLDIDGDGDGISDLRESGQTDADNNGRIDGTADTDGDGYGDQVDPKIGHAGAASEPAGPGTPATITPTDTDANSRYNGNPTTDNADNDASYNFQDADSDNDGITDNVEAQSTAAYILYSAPDTDNDGLSNVYEGPTGGGLVPYNFDGTDNPDYLDPDTDNDGKKDIVEAHDYNLDGFANDDVALTNFDSDGDGIDNKFDLVSGFNVTTEGIGNPPIPGSRGPLQISVLGAPDRDFRNAAVILPIILAKFEGKVTGTAIALNWTTVSEQQSSFFEIERSANGVNYTVIGKVAAAGNSSASTHYSFTDQTPNPSVNHYRLRMVDIDGRASLSKTLLFRFGPQTKGITLLPNPVRTQLQLAWNNMPQGEYKIEIISPNGQLLKTFRTVVTSVNQVMLIPRDAGWKGGSYVVRITTKTTRHTEKVILE